MQMMKKRRKGGRENADDEEEKERGQRKCGWWGRERVQRAIGIMSHLKRVPPKNSPQILFSPSPGSTNCIKVGKMATFKVGEMATFRAAVYFWETLLWENKVACMLYRPLRGKLEEYHCPYREVFYKAPIQFFLASTFFRHETKKLWKVFVIFWNEIDLLDFCVHADFLHAGYALIPYIL